METNSDDNNPKKTKGKTKEEKLVRNKDVKEVVEKEDDAKTVTEEHNVNKTEKKDSTMKIKEKKKDNAKKELKKDDVEKEIEEENVKKISEKKDKVKEKKKHRAEKVVENENDKNDEAKKEDSAKKELEKENDEETEMAEENVKGIPEKEDKVKKKKKKHNTKIAVEEDNDVNNEEKKEDTVKTKLEKENDEETELEGENAKKTEKEDKVKKKKKKHSTKIIVVEENDEETELEEENAKKTEKEDKVKKKKEKHSTKIVMEEDNDAKDTMKKVTVSNNVDANESVSIEIKSIIKEELNISENDSEDEFQDYKTTSEDDEIIDNNYSDATYLARQMTWKEKPSWEESKKLYGLRVRLRHTVPPQHTIETRAGSHLPTLNEIKQFQEIAPLKKGLYSSAEDDIIVGNWNAFCELHDWDAKKVHQFLHFRSKRNELNIRSLEERRKFVQFLADGLPNRTLYSVYHRFKTLYEQNVQTRYTAAEDEMILEHLERNPSLDEKRKYADLAKVLRRTRHSIYRRYRILKGRKRKREENEDIPLEDFLLRKKDTSKNRKNTLSETEDDESRMNIKNRKRKKT